MDIYYHSVFKVEKLDVSLVGDQKLYRNKFYWVAKVLSLYI